MKPSLWILIAGVTLVLSGAVHGIIGLIDGDTWQGPLSIRKPVLFGISSGVTLISLAWIQDKLKPSKYDTFLSPLFAAAMTIEVGLITLQFWRSEASHFNHSTSLDSAIDRLITVLIIFVSIVILNLARRSFSDLDAARDLQLAIRSGLAFLLVSCGLGFFILFYGEYLASLHRDPETFGAAGVMKFPHGITIHAIQFLPIQVWLTSKLGVSESQRIRFVHYSTAAMAALLIFSMIQTFSGRARFEMGAAGGIALATAAMLSFPVVRGTLIAMLSRKGS